MSFLHRMHRRQDRYWGCAGCRWCRSILDSSLTMWQNWSLIEVACLCSRQGWPVWELVEEVQACVLPLPLAVVSVSVSVSVWAEAVLADVFAEVVLVADRRP